MNAKHMLAILSGLALILPMMQQNTMAALPPADTRNMSATSLDLIEECLNTMTCNAKVYTGNTVKFTGTLTDDSGNPIPDAPVNILALVPKPAIVLLTNSTTNIDGVFEAEWTVKLSSQETAFQDVTRQFRTESVTAYAEFPGNDGYKPSRSNKLTMSVTVNTIHPIVNSDKTTYNEGDNVSIFIAFVDSADNFIDPESIFATVNNKDVELEKKKTGSYTLTLPNIPKQHTQLLIVPIQPGYNTDTAYLTIIVGGLR